MPDEERLPGGWINEVVRVGDTVRRTPPANAGFVTALLRHLAGAGPHIAPRDLGVDERGRQVLGHVDGRVPWRDREDPAYFSDAALTRLAELIRALHDACAGTPLAGAAETVCHRDLSPKNTVYRDSPAGPVPVAFLDWDLAGPGRRIEDVAFAGWHWADLGGDADPVEFGRRCRLLCDAYDLAYRHTPARPAADRRPRTARTADQHPNTAGTPDRHTAAAPAVDRAPSGLVAPGEAPVRRAGTTPLARHELVEVMLGQIEGTWRGIAAGAERDDPGMRRLRDAGAVDGVRGWQDWLRTHRRTVEAALA